MDGSQVATTSKKGEPIISTMGRPPSVQPIVNIDDSVRGEILRLRSAGDRPLGPKVIHAKLSNNPRFSAYTIPSQRSISRFLKHVGLSRTYTQKASFESNPNQCASNSHERWQLDAKGGRKL